LTFSVAVPETEVPVMRVTSSVAVIVVVPVEVPAVASPLDPMVATVVLDDDQRTFAVRSTTGQVVDVDQDEGVVLV
jgi:hypothetical protein